MKKELKDCEFHIACDVTNPLCGEQGCSAIFGPQKGATEQMVKDMDQWLADYAKIAKESFTKADANKPGTGAAGGLGFSGAVTKGAIACNEAGIDAYFPIVRSAVPLEDAMKKKNAQENLTDTVEQVFRVIKALK